ncbi:HZS-alpha domain-containing protein [Sulfidibacter corallicola]|uniref:Hydrazine synthase alpha subunit middle domain-containing protein n=1 Tax=Sulfidibacter corallicola TaxID=2818388 RepID=A0A8A4THT1_SULCO|nr:hypothetical protein [Sulfidibacter corallicola]QTD48318.1 hypothetical protein J3U87_22290 [Sulfidibacter corallicola]
MFFPRDLPHRAPRIMHFVAALALWLAVQPLVAQVDYDILYLRAPRYGDGQNTIWPEVFHPASMEPGTDLMLLHPGGSEEVLIDAGDGAVADTVLSFDAKTVYYSLFPDMSDDALNGQRADLPRQGADIYKMDLETREITRLTFGEWTPNQAAGNWTDEPVGAGASNDQNYLGYGILNLGPCPLPDGRIMFTSNRNGFMPNKSFTQVCLQLYVMDDDGRNVEQVGFLNIGAALHPTILKDGRVMFSSYEAQGLRDRRLWALWSIWPDGRNWGPLMSAFKHSAAFHFQTQLTDGRIAVVDYYNLNNNGFGALLAFPANPSEMPTFGSPFPNDDSNPPIQAGIHSNGNLRFTRYPFSPVGLETLTPFTHGDDNAAPLSDPDNQNSVRVGKVTHPSASADGVLVVWTPGPANDLSRPTPQPYYDGGIYLLANNFPAQDATDLVLVKNDPNYNEQWPKAVLPYSAIHGVEKPVRLPWLPNEGEEHEELPAGTPFGLVGTSSFYNRNTSPGSGSSRFDGLDPFNTSQNNVSSNWGIQGSDAGLYTNADIWAVRVLAMEPTSHRSYGPNGGCCGAQRNFDSHANERLRILGEIPLRKEDGQGQPLLDGDGNPDTSFLARIPADVPFTFQTLDRNRMALNTSQTWHQVRPGEVRTDCGGCHAHAEMPTDFEQTAAALPTFTISDLVHQTPILSKDAQGEPNVITLAERAVDVEYYRDIKPILQASCVPCHSTSNPQAQLVLDEEHLVDRHENSYNRLARDSDAQYGYPPVISNGTWRQTNASRYIRKFQSRRSLLVWKVFGERLDGWTNEDHPTESEPGNAATLPDGANPNEADLDFTGTIMPPPGAVHPDTNQPIPALTEDQKMLIATWIDLGCPANETEATGGNRTNMGWFLDDLRPTLTISAPRAGLQTRPLTELNIGAFDYYSGLVVESLSVTANFSVNGNAPGTELASLFTESEDHVWTLALQTPILELADGELVVTVRDEQGNISELKRAFGVQSRPLLLFPLQAWQNATNYDGDFDFNTNNVNEVLDMVSFLNDL